MLDFRFVARGTSGLEVLCIGAHSDDIEIGCGGTMLRLLDELPGVRVRWVVLGAGGAREAEAIASADLFLKKAGARNVVVRDFEDGFFPHQGAAIKRFFETLKGEPAPDLVFTHYRHDLHQDHRVVSELTWNTFRDQLILEYEIVKYDGDLGTPNLFVQLENDVCRRKVANLMQCFGTQRSKQWFSEDTFLAMLRLRGLECNAVDRYAEAFYCRKLRF